MPSEPSPDPNGDTTALPVAVEVAEPFAGEVRRHVEGLLGWQPVDGATAAVVPPALRLVSPSTPPGPDGVPAVLLLDATVPAVAAARAGARHRPVATLGWPDDRERLAATAAQVLADAPGEPGERDVVRVAGAGGGVGTSTVALALAGLAAWRESRVLVVVGPGAPVGEVRRVPADALGAHDLLRRATALPGVPGAAAVRVEGPVGEVDRAATGADLVVLDAGPGSDADLLVCRPDRVALEQLPATTAGAVVVNGDGPADERSLSRAIGGRVRVALPSSTRVARAGLLARVPAGLPGSWLRRLLPVVPRSGAGATEGPGHPLRPPRSPAGPWSGASGARRARRA